MEAKDRPFHAFCRELFMDRFGSSLEEWIRRLGCQPHEPARWSQGVAMPDVKMLIAIHESVVGTPTLVNGEQRDRWYEIIEMATDDVALVPEALSGKYSGTLYWTMQRTLALELSDCVTRCPIKSRLALLRRLLNNCRVDEHYRPKS